MRQKDKKGRLPLHTISNIATSCTDSDRLALVAVVWKAYPEAASILDPVRGIPPFALPVRGAEEGEPYYPFNYRYGLSSAFVLLRENPDILSKGAGCKKYNASAALEPPPKKRPCTMSSKQPA